MKGDLDMQNGGQRSEGGGQHEMMRWRERMEVMMAESLRVLLLMPGRGCTMTLPCALG